MVAGEDVTTSCDDNIAIYYRFQNYLTAEIQQTMVIGVNLFRRARDILQTVFMINEVKSCTIDNATAVSTTVLVNVVFTIDRIVLDNRKLLSYNYQNLIGNLGKLYGDFSGDQLEYKAAVKSTLEDGK